MSQCDYCTHIQLSSFSKIALLFRFDRRSGVAYLSSTNLGQKTKAVDRRPTPKCPGGRWRPPPCTQPPPSAPTPPKASAAASADSAGRFQASLVPRQHRTQKRRVDSRHSIYQRRTESWLDFIFFRQQEQHNELK